MPTTMKIIIQITGRLYSIHTHYEDTDPLQPGAEYPLTMSGQEPSLKGSVPPGNEPLPYVLAKAAHWLECLDGTINAAHGMEDGGLD